MLGNEAFVKLNETQKQKLIAHIPIVDQCNGTRYVCTVCCVNPKLMYSASNTDCVLGINVKTFSIT